MRNIIFALILCFTPLIASAQLVDKLIADMGSNDATLMNAPSTEWAQRGYLDMGFAARGDATPLYWANEQGGSFVSSDPWTAILPWFHIWPIEGNTSSARVQVWDIRLQVLINGTWQLIDYPKSQWAQLEPWNLIGDKEPIDQVNEGNGIYTYWMANEGPIHGGLGKHALSDFGINPADIKGVSISAKAEIVEGSADVLFEIGGDYYPYTWVSVEDDFVLGYGPAIGGSKFTRIQGTTCVNMTTISPPALGDASVYSQAGGKQSLTHAELAANPPEDFCGVEDTGEGDTGTGDTGGCDCGGDTGDGDTGSDTSNLVEKSEMVNILQGVVNTLQQSISNLSQ